MITRPPVFVVSGPSGVEKTSLVQNFFKRTHRHLYHHCVTVTTRKKRYGEGMTSHQFVNVETFQTLISLSHFLEYSQIYDDYYGLPKSEISNYVGNYDPIAVLDVSGFRKVKEAYPESCYSIFIMPSDFDNLFDRLNKRIHNTFDMAKQEIACAGEYDKIIVNDDPKRAYDELSEVIESVSYNYYNRT